MKKVVLALLTIVLILSAVEWEVEQVIDESGLPANMSILTLDRYEHPHILYTANDTGLKVNVLKYASPGGDNWVINYVDDVSQYKALDFSFDFTPSNDVMIAYTQVDHSGNLDLYLACDSSALFDITNLTDDPLLQLDPVVHVGSDGIVRLVYREQNDDGFNIRYGWRDGEGFLSESVKDSMSTHLRGFDFVLDAENEPHVFYQGDDAMLWYASRVSENNWSIESLELSGDQPSVMIDGAGYFHIGYMNPPDIYYVTNESGTWQDEPAAVNDTGDQNWERPSLALDPEWIPHITWWTWTAPYHVWSNEVFYIGRAGGTWSEPDSLPPNEHKMFGQVNPFHIDTEGYGHICYTIYNDLYYVKTTEPMHSSIADQPVEANSFAFEVRGSVVHFSLPESSYFHLNLYDALGRRVCCIASGVYESGEHSIPINQAELAAGVYFVRFESTNLQACAKFVVTH